MTIEWQQYYPTYKFSDRDILLKEYEGSLRTVESKERVFLNLANLTLIVATVFTTLLVALISKPEFQKQINSLPPRALLSLLIVIIIFAPLTLQYFAARHKSIVFDSRKIVVLRRMLGLDYGSQQLVLPQWRIEGATNPFAIKMFPGWFSYAAYPFWVIGVFSTLLFFNLLPLVANVLPDALPPRADVDSLIALICAAWAVCLAMALRIELYDTHESIKLSIARMGARILNLSLVEDFEYIIYRAKLAMHEINRLRVDTKTFLPLLIFIEDREFYQHGGVSFRATTRALLGVFGFKRSSGGSTITQQLARTLFIIGGNKIFRRKAIEIILAKWLETICSKEEILKIYLASVRFEARIYGVPAASRYFFDLNVWETPTKAQAFFLIERVSNVKSDILPSKISHTVRQLLDARLISAGDVEEILEIYRRMVATGKVKPAGLALLEEKLMAPSVA